eukprot:scaffold65276_cov13-Tisochrysis_lutea.AAC.1
MHKPPPALSLPQSSRVKRGSTTGSGTAQSGALARCARAPGACAEREVGRGREGQGREKGRGERESREGEGERVPREREGMEEREERCGERV